MRKLVAGILKKVPGAIKLYDNVIYPEIIYSFRYKKNKAMIEKSPVDFVKYIYERHTGDKLNLENPTSFNEKLQWLKLNHYDDLAVKCADKYAVRGYVREKGLGKLLNDVIEVYEDVKDIDFDSLPNRFVLKLNHGSGMNIIVKDKSKINKNKIVKKLKKWMSTNYSYMSGEWVYRDIKPKILCEKFIEDSKGELNDYKIFCFNGKAHYIQVDLERFTDHKRNIYTTSWDLLDLSIGYPNDIMKAVAAPKNLNELIEYAEKLAEPFVHARVDFYNLDNLIVFGELTFFHGGGFEKFTPAEFGVQFGDKIEINKLPLIEAWKKQ